ncbi:hypothetical protein BH18ACT2_BH18ACT2_24040 [soil metagenome]
MPVLTVTGIASGLWQSDVRPTTLVTSTYGAILGAKVLLVAVMVALGWWQRTRLLAAVDATGRLFRTARGELAVGALVVAATAALVNTVPAREFVDAGPLNATISDDGGTVSVTVDPARPGANVFHLYFFDDAGAPRVVDVAEATVVQGDLPPRDIELLSITPNHLTADDLTIAAPGPATFTVTSLTRGVPSTFTFEVPIR